MHHAVTFAHILEEVFDGPDARDDDDTDMAIEEDCEKGRVLDNVRVCKIQPCFASSVWSPAAHYHSRTALSKVCLITERLREMFDAFCFLVILAASDFTLVQMLADEHVVVFRR